jgi:hypothetical protein
MNRGIYQSSLKLAKNFKNFWQGFLIKNLAKFRARNFSPEIYLWYMGTSEAGRRLCGEKI